MPCHSAGGSGPLMLARSTAASRVHIGCTGIVGTSGASLTSCLKALAVHNTITIITTEFIHEVEVREKLNTHQWPHIRVSKGRQMQHQVSSVCLVGLQWEAAIPCLGKSSLCQRGWHQSATTILHSRTVVQTLPTITHYSYQQED